jgi:DnaJ-domain-containing protein 1
MLQNPEHHNDIQAVHTHLLNILQQYPDGLSEYELFSALAELGLDAFDKSAFSNEHRLFCRHFILFHALYRLRDELLLRQQYLLEISALKICLLPWSAGQAALVQHEPLRAYYLDILELEKITPEEVADMLGRFWASYHSQQGRESALHILDLQDPVDIDTIRKQYRQLAMRFHPDRGGDTGKFQEVNAAMRLLELSWR